MAAVKNVVREGVHGLDKRLAIGRVSPKPLFPVIDPLSCQSARIILDFYRP